MSAFPPTPQVTAVLPKHQAENHMRVPLEVGRLSVCRTSVIHLSLHSTLYCILGRSRLRLRGRAITVLYSTSVCFERAAPTRKQVPLCLDVAPPPHTNMAEIKHLLLWPEGAQHQSARKRSSAGFQKCSTMHGGPDSGPPV